MTTAADLQPQNTVSWQSAFWAIIPIALNSMTQPAGSVFDYHGRDQCFALRSSPIVCASDAVFFLYCLIRQTVLVGSPHEALKLVVQHRYRNEDREGQTSAAKLQQNFMFRLALFALGALPQVVKILSIRGTPLTTTMGLLYFVSFLILEVSVCFAPRSADGRHLRQIEDLSTHPGHATVERRLDTAIVSINSILQTIPLGSAVYQIAKAIGARTWPYVLGLCFIALAPIVDSCWLSNEKATMLQVMILVPNILSIFLSCCLLLPVGEAARSAESKSYLGLCIMVVIVVVAGVLTNQIYWTKALVGKEMQTKQADASLGSLCVLWTLGTALLYYVFVYDPTGTYKPEWVNQLG